MGDRKRRLWVSYLRVSTPEQATKELSLAAQHDAVQQYARRHGRTIGHQYLEPGCSGTDINRPAFCQMLQDVLRPGSDIAGIVVHHTSRFTRNATQARVVKEQLRKRGVKVMSVCQDLNDDPMGQLIEGIFECIDQYESEINGMRTRAAMQEAVRQGFFPGGAAPYGYRVKKVEVRPGLTRPVLAVDQHEAKVVRQLFRLYVASSGAKTVAQQLNRQRQWYRRDTPWSKDLVLRVLQEPAVAGTYWWGKRDGKTGHKRDRAEWLPLTVERIVDPELHELALHLRSQREPTRNPGRAASPQLLLRGLVRCGRCGASYSLETSGKRVNGEVYKYRYYNCRTACRIGKEACPGGRIPASKLDDAVLDFIAHAVCTESRCAALLGLDQGTENNGTTTAEQEQLVASAREAWATMIRTAGTVGRNYLHHLIEHIHVGENGVTVVGKEPYRTKS